MLLLFIGLNINHEVVQLKEVNDNVSPWVVFLQNRKLLEVSFRVKKEVKSSSIL